jgi:hypothetical protein
MFCQNCGSPVQGNFCSNCGAKLNSNTPPNCQTEPVQNKPKFKVPIILIILLWASSSGQYLNEGFELSQANMYGLIDIAVASILMLCYPFISRIINKEQIEYYECRSMCIGNSIILFIISLVLTATIGFGFVGGLGAVMYYYINMNLFSAPKTERVKKENKEPIDDYIYDPSLSDIENQKNRFSQMDIITLDDLIKNKKEEYTEETYAIALEQYKLRSEELPKTSRVDELKLEISQLDEALLNLTKMLSQAKKDLGNLTIEDAENMYRQKLISEAQKNEMINSIEVLQTTIDLTPKNIAETQKLKSELEQELNKIQS